MRERNIKLSVMALFSISIDLLSWRNVRRRNGEQSAIEADQWRSLMAAKSSIGVSCACKYEAVSNIGRLQTINSSGSKRFAAVAHQV
jgi:hypothetical protein